MPSEMEMNVITKPTFEVETVPFHWIGSKTLYIEETEEIKGLAGKAFENFGFSVSSDISKCDVYVSLSVCAADAQMVLSDEIVHRLEDGSIAVICVEDALVLLTSGNVSEFDPKTGTVTFRSGRVFDSLRSLFYDALEDPI